jgi:hypothetical protein
MAMMLVQCPTCGNSFDWRPESGPVRSMVAEAYILSGEFVSLSARHSTKDIFGMPLPAATRSTRSTGVWSDHTVILTMPSTM